MFSHFKIVFAILMVLTGNLILKTSSSIQSVCKKSLDLRYTLLENPTAAVQKYCLLHFPSQTNSSSIPLICSINLSTSTSSDICNDSKDLYIPSVRYWFLSSRCSIKNTVIFKINMKILR